MSWYQYHCVMYACKAAGIFFHQLDIPEIDAASAAGDASMARSTALVSAPVRKFSIAVTAQHTRGAQHASCSMGDWLA